MDTTIESISALEILNSRGNPTVEVEVMLADGTWDAQRFHPEPRPACMKPSNCATATRNASAAKA